MLFTPFLQLNKLSNLETLSQHVEDQPYIYAKLFANELVKINQTYQDDFNLRIEDVEMLASNWMIELCTTAKQSVREMCERFDSITEHSRHSTTGIVGFLGGVDLLFWLTL